MKNIFKGLAAVSLLFLGSCGKDFLEVKPTEFISSEQITEASKLNPDLQNANISGIYANMYTPGTGGTNLAHDDFGQRGYDIYTDMLCADMAHYKVNYGWYTGISRLQSTVDYTSTDNYKPWRYYYRIIRGANTVIDGLGGNDAVLADDASKYIMGQAKAMRAYGYFYLANLFANKYDPTMAILPIYVNTTDPNQPLSTTQEVYDLIVKDLNESITLLDGFTRAAKNEVDKTVAQTLLAYAYASMGDWANSALMSDAVIQSGAYTIMDIDEAVGGFNDVNTPGWIWGVDLTTEIGLDLVSWWGQVDIFTYSYAAVGNTKTMDEGLYSKIPANDIRKSQFLNVPGHNYYLTPYNKFYAPERKVFTQRTILTDYVYLRVSEMYLLNAEANAHSGSEATAKERLKDLLSNRFADAADYAYVDGLTGQALLDEIYLQTRIELWGEGKSYLAMKRNHATVTRGPNHFYLAGQSFSYDDDRLTFEIPQSEVQNNPNISE